MEVIRKAAKRVDKAYLEALRARTKALWQNPEYRTKTLAAVRARAQATEERESRKNRMVAFWQDPTRRANRENNLSIKKSGVAQTSPLLKKGPGHYLSEFMHLRDPRGREWIFRNTHHFVRTHPDLFDPADTVFRVRGYGKHKRHTTAWCRATVGLLSLRRRVRVSGSWKGWTVVSLTENGEDLLARSDLDFEI